MYKILIVEDDMMIAKTLSSHLEKWDYEVRYVKDFKNVMNDFLEFDPQLVLMDIILPLFNGFHWCTEIRKIAKTPIVFLSSASDNMNIVMAMNMGGDDFIEGNAAKSLLISGKFKCSGASGTVAESE